MKQSSLSGGGLVLFAVALAGSQAVPARAQTVAPAPAVADPAAPAVTAAPIPTTSASQEPASPAPAPPAPVAAAPPEPAKPEPEKPTRTAALPEVTKPPTPATARSASPTEQHITRLHQALKITPAQQPQWDAFAQVMRDNAAHMEAVAKAHPENAEKVNAIDGLKSYEEVTQAHLEDLQKLEPAFETLYGTLSESQKKTADAMFSRRAEVKKPKPIKAGAPTAEE